MAIPEMLNACENKNHIDKRVSRFVIPFSVTLSANGSALFITAAAMFIASITGHSLTFGDVVIIG
jgi:solute carrier family 1 (high affinity glutamate transporter) protein 2